MQSPPLTSLCLPIRAAAAACLFTDPSPAFAVPDPRRGTVARLVTLLPGSESGTGSLARPRPTHLAGGTGPGPSPVPCQRRRPDDSLPSLSVRPGPPRPVRCFHWQLRVHPRPWPAAAAASGQILLAAPVL